MPPQMSGIVSVFGSSPPSPATSEEALQDELFLNSFHEVEEPFESKKEFLLKHPQLWRAGQLHQESRTTPSAFEVLDRHLPGGGWPTDSLCELLLPQVGIGELQLLAPALARLSAQNRWLTWINPPFVPNPPALQALGVNVDKVLLIRTDQEGQDGRTTFRDALWAFERASRSGACSAAFCWLDERQMNARHTQRLQVAAKQGNAFACLFRPPSAQTQASMAPLRLQLTPASTPTGARQQKLGVSILKRRGGWAVHDLVIDLAAGAQQSATVGAAQYEALLERWRNTRAEDARMNFNWQSHPLLHSTPRGLH